MLEHRRRRATPQIDRNPLPPFGLWAVSGTLPRCRSSTMLRQRLRRGALHRTQERPQRGHAHDSDRLLNVTSPTG